MIKPIPLPLLILDWNNAMMYIEQKYNLETVEGNYPVKILYEFLSFLDYLPKGGNVVAEIPFADIYTFVCSTPSLTGSLATRNGMTPDEYKQILEGVIKLILDEYPTDNKKIYWGF